MELTPAIKEWVSKKVSKIEKKLPKIHKIEVELDYYPGKAEQRNECEITIFADHVIFRATAENQDMYVAVDRAIEKILRQVEKYKGRTYASENKRNHESKANYSSPAELKSVKKVVKNKKFSLTEMTVEQALHQMEYLGHDFFVFVNSDNGAVSVVYERRDGNYGLIETDVVVS